MADASPVAASGGDGDALIRWWHELLGDDAMRSNSGKDESRNNMRDPTVRDRTEQRTKRSHRTHISHAKAPADHREGRKHH
jgi:hypothetical protein